MVKEENKLLCRVCLQCDLDNDRVSTIFDNNDNGFIYEKLNCIADVHIKPDDGLPDKICAECLEELENAINFKHKCETSNSILVSAVSAGNSLKEEPVKVEIEEYTEHEYLDEDLTSLSDLDLKHDELHDLGQPQIHLEPPSKPSRAIDLKLECHDCGNLFKSKCKLKVHWFKVHLKAQLTCPICQKRFGSFKRLNEHKVNRSRRCIAFSHVNIINEGKSKVLQCKECNYSTRRIQTIITHVATHSSEKKFVCKLCPKKYSQYGGLQAHVENKHNGSTKLKICKICGEHLDGYYKYSRHMGKHRESVSVTCEICHKKLRKRNLENHMATHSTDKPFTCDICASRYRTMQALNGHKRQVHEKKIHKYKCAMCGYTTRCNSIIKRHRAKHLEHKFPCTQCGKFFDNEHQLSLHKVRHTERHQVCPHCNSKFFCRKNMLRHLNKIHNIYYT